MGRGRERDKVAEVARRPRPDPSREQELRPDPHRERPFQPATLTAVALHAPFEVARRVREEEAGGVQRDLGRTVLGGQATARPKSGTTEAEMIRHLKAARDTAIKARTQAMPALKALVVGAPAALRERLEAIAGTMALLRHLAALRPRPLTTTTA